MGLWLIPIRVPTAEIHVEADRRLAFQVLTAWGAARPDGRPTSKVLEEDGDRVLCEFYTPVNGLFGFKWLQLAAANGGMGHSERAGGHTVRSDQGAAPRSAMYLVVRRMGGMHRFQI